MLDLITKRRSIRKYKQQPIEKEKVEQILKAALWAPTSRNTRPWEFIVVTDREKLEKLSVAKTGAHALKNAPLAIAVLADPAVSDVWVEDASIAMIFMQLTAETLGIGSCWIQIRERFHTPEISADRYVKDILNIPDDKRILAILALGYPDETKKPHSEEELDFGKVHYEQYGSK